MAFKASVILRDKVRKAYSAAAERPHQTHAFPVGRAFAESLGYPQELLAGLPNISVVSIGMAQFHNGRLVPIAREVGKPAMSLS
jgi:hypothetical protein